MTIPEASSKADHESSFWKQVRKDFDADVVDISSEKDKSDQLVSIQSFSIGFIHEVSRRPIDEIAVEQQGIYVWYMFLQTAKILDKDDLFQEKLISLLQWTKEFDSLRKSLHPTETVKADWESYGFTESLQETWEHLVTTKNISQQCSLALFSSKALAIGVCQDMLGLTALWFLREALETDDEARTMALLPAAAVWVNHSSLKLLTFSATNKTYDGKSKAYFLAPGILAQKADVNQDGFSMKRWLFWRRRFQDFSHSKDLVVAKEAKKGFMDMILCGRQLEYEVPGEAKFTERLQAVMAEELAKSGKQSVDGEDIDINVDWVD